MTHRTPALLIGLVLGATACSDGATGATQSDTSDTASAPDATADTTPVDTSPPVELPGSDTPSETSTPDAVDTSDAADPSDTADTADTAAPGDATDTSAPPTDVPVTSDALFDLALLGDAALADCTFTPGARTIRSGVLLDTWTVSYRSYEWAEGALHPILIRGFAARRVDATGQSPGLIVAHGLGGASKLNDALDAAARLRTFALAYTGPGGGTEPDNTSEGLPAGHGDGYRMFDVLEDSRGSWFWAHTTAALRGLTCLAERPEVDADRLGMTGYSAGGVATLIATGVDPRIKAAVPLSGTGAWFVATEAPNAWQHALLTAAGLSIASPEWQKLMAELDATVLVPGATGATLLINGSTDEFFPLTAHLATYDAIGGPKRTAIAANYDHGCYSLTGVEDADAIEARVKIRAEGGQAAWFGHHFGTDARFSALPAEPSVTLTTIGAATQITALIDESPAGLLVDKVTLWLSDDRSGLYVGIDLSRGAPGVWQALAPGTPSAQAITYVDAQYRTRAAPTTRFALASRPSIPAGLVPRIREITSCLLP